jgi:hypothetical protein
VDSFIDVGGSKIRLNTCHFTSDPGGRHSPKWVSCDGIHLAIAMTAPHLLDCFADCLGLLDQVALPVVSTLLAVPAGEPGSMRTKAQTRLDIESEAGYSLPRKMIEWLSAESGSGYTIGFVGDKAVCHILPQPIHAPVIWKICDPLGELIGSATSFVDAKLWCEKQIGHLLSGSISLK